MFTFVGVGCRWNELDDSLGKVLGFFLLSEGWVGYIYVTNFMITVFMQTRLLIKTLHIKIWIVKAHTVKYWIPLSTDLQSV